jgi:hypothetical protein
MEIKIGQVCTVPSNGCGLSSPRASLSRAWGTCFGPGMELTDGPARSSLLVTVRRSFLRLPPPRDMQQPTPQAPTLSVLPPRRGSMREAPAAQAGQYQKIFGSFP